VDAVRLAEIVGAHHVAMRDPARKADLLLEALEDIGITQRQGRVERLERDRFLKLAIVRAIHDAHSSRAELLAQLVATREQGPIGEAPVWSAPPLGAWPPTAQVIDQQLLLLQLERHLPERLGQLTHFVAGIANRGRGEIAFADFSRRVHQGLDGPRDPAGEPRRAEQ
jgi:hypothetical protein